MGILAGVEAELSKLWTEVSGEARTALESALSDAKAEVSVLEAKAADIEAKLRTAVSEAKAEAEAAVAAAEPGVKASVQALVAKLLAAVEGALGA